jgi:probable HAF family extracellular repeat protein
MFANANNILGQVVGYTGAARTYQYPFLWDNNSWTALGSFGDTPDSGNAINNKGQVVGQIGGNECTGCNPGHAASWTNGETVDLGTLAGSDPFYEYGSSANDVNELGKIVGWSGTGGTDTYSGVQLVYGPFHAVSWTTTGAIRDLGTLPGDVLSTALKINLFGQVIGTSGNTAIYSLYNGEYGELVSSCCSVGVSGRPFIWTQRRGMQDLNTLIRANSGWVLNTATGINRWGQIVGSGTRNGQTHGFLLTPCESVTGM